MSRINNSNHVRVVRQFEAVEGAVWKVQYCRFRPQKVKWKGQEKGSAVTLWFRLRNCTHLQSNWQFGFVTARLQIFLHYRNISRRKWEYLLCTEGRRAGCLTALESPSAEVTVNFVPSARWMAQAVCLRPPFDPKRVRVVSRQSGTGTGFPSSIVTSMFRAHISSSAIDTVLLSKWQHR